MLLDAQYVIAVHDIEDDLVEVMVEVAEGKIEREELADYLAVVCMVS